MFILKRSRLRTWYPIRNTSGIFLKATLLGPQQTLICYQINPVKVSRRDGVNYVFNGQHTIEIVALVSGSRDTPVWCMIYEELVYEHEADIFANQQKFVKPLSPYEVFLRTWKPGTMTN